MPKEQERTPMMRQYFAIKEEVPDTLLLFRLGDFYEMFYDDAVIASRDLDITLTARHKESASPVPMCGVPYHAAEGYIAKLLGKGHKVAICDQTAPPKKGVKLVPREISRIITPGTVTDMTVLTPGRNNYILGLLARDDKLGTAFLDVSTGEFRVSESGASDRWDQLMLDVEHFSPREVVFPRGSEDGLPTLDGCVRTPVDEWVFDRAAATRTLCEQFGTTDLDGFGCTDKPLAIGAAGALVHYARRTQKADLEHITGLTCSESADYMILDASSIRNLELVESASGARSETLLGVIDRTSTGMGARLVRKWLLRPSIDREEIVLRQDAVGELVASIARLEELRTGLDRMSDIERLLSKVTVGSTVPRELVALRNSFARLPAIGTMLGVLESDRFGQLAEELDPLEDLHVLLDTSIKEEPALKLADGGVIRDGYHEGLDELREVSLNSKAYLASLERREKDRTGIGSLKVRFNRVFGYYIEVSKTNLHLVPDDYIRKQTLVGAERFITPELKDYEEKILTAEDRITTLEKELFEKIRLRIAGESARIRRSASVVAQCDVLSGFALLARKFGYSRPEISDNDVLMISKGRHVVLESLADDHRAERFVPNDLFMNDDQNRIQIITGPNMGGKSTFLRQNALIIILAQMGSFIPAQLVRFPIVDRVFTRIGASDNLARGRSTFMVEMTEASIILNSATSRSLVILDEVGRGTATFDGLSIAWAVVEHIQSHIGAKTLFATHYHELTELADLLPGIENFHLAVKEADNRIIFLRRVEPGAANRSYGIEVARMAGLPPSVIRRAREILKKHEDTEHELSDNLTLRAKRKKRIVINQLSLFSPEEEELRARVRGLDLDHVAPFEALQILAELRAKIDES
jgi:DNA mismatch repair protein MutS